MTDPVATPREQSAPTVIFEDEVLLVVSKPAGLMVHTDGRAAGETLVDWVRSTRPDMAGVGENMILQNGEVIDRPGVVHRLDRDTSGVIVLAKTQDTFLFLKSQFQHHAIEKLYHAFVWGELRDAHGTIDKPIGRSRKDFRLWSAGSDAGGTMRAATTRWTLLAAREGFSYLALEPRTGRTHQIRVHLKAIGHPVVCDTRYAPKKVCALGFERLALHALTLSLTHPSGMRMTFEAPLPEDFRHACELLGIR
jgi:23S rRNA pseudouridine1911/1915/1917 synthase